MNGNTVLSTIFLGGTEERHLEFKEGFNWNDEHSAKIKDELIKAILAMSNIPGGGTVVLGVRTDTSKKEIFPEGLALKDKLSFVSNEEQIRTVIHSYCQRPIEFKMSAESHPQKETMWFVLFKVEEFAKWPTITVKPSKTKEDGGKVCVIENHAIYTRSKLAQWSSIKAGPQEIEDIIEMSVRKFDGAVQRLGYTRATQQEQEISSWYSRHEKIANEDLKILGIQAFMEVKAEFVVSDQLFGNTALRDAARVSTIPTFGWPIAVFLDTVPAYRPVADDGGIKAELSIEKQPLDDSKTFDYWAIHKSGAFYLLTSLFEDQRDKEIISFNTRIVRITEVFMYLNNLYRQLGIDPKKEINVTIKHGGIKGRRLSTLSQNRLMFSNDQSSQDVVSTKVTTSIDGFIKDAASVVEEFTIPLFEAFNFHKIDRKIVESIVKEYLQGNVT